MFKKRSPKPYSKNSLRKKAKEIALIVKSKSAQLGLTEKEVIDRIKRGEIRL